MASGAPSTFPEAMSDIAGRLAGAAQLPDADPDLAMGLVALITKWSQGKHGAQAGSPGGQPQPGQQAGGPPPGLNLPGGPAGGGSPNQTQPNMAAPNLGGRGPTPGLTPNPDEMRRVMQQATAGG